MAHKPGTDRVLVPISRDDRLWLRERGATTGQSVAAQLGEIVQRSLRRMRSRRAGNRHLEVAPPREAASAE
jgi:hypothetical protein